MCAASNSADTAPDDRAVVSSLIGREREVALLRDRLVAARAGHGGLVLIGGEAGIGKTTLAEFIRDEAATESACTLVGRCYDLTETPPYGPWIELFRHYHAAGGAPSLPTAFAQRGTVGAVASPVALVQQVQDFFAALTAQRPVLLLLDDLHWADPASLDLLRSLARVTADLPLLILATYRADEITRRHPLSQLLPMLVRESSAARLGLRRLTMEETQSLVVARYGLPALDAARLAISLQTRAEGNPFFTGEILRAIEEEGMLRRTGGRYILGDIADVPVPALVRQVIDARVERLGEAARSALAVAAVIGQRAPLDLWTTIAETDEDALAALAERARQARLLDETTEGDGVRFAHALIRETLYESMPTIHRRRIHRQIGEALAARPDADPDAVADHFQRAGDGRMAEWLVKAGERAQCAWAWMTAAERYAAALAFLEARGTDAGERGWLLLRLARLLQYSGSRKGIALIDAAAPLAAAAGDRTLAAYILYYQGQIRCQAGAYREGLPLAEAGVAALAAAPPLDAALRARLGLWDARPARITYMSCLTDAGRFAEARALREEFIAATADGERVSERFAAAVGHRAMALVHAFAGWPEEARRSTADARDGFRAVDWLASRASSLMRELQWIVLPYQADALAERQRLVAAAEQVAEQETGRWNARPARFVHLPLLFLEGGWDEARMLATDGMDDDYVSNRALASDVLGPLAHAQGDAARAWAVVRHWLPDGPETAPGGAMYPTASALQRLAAQLALDAGDRDAARQWLEAHDRWLAWSGAVLGQSEAHLLWARYHRALGDHARARADAMDALALATEPRQPLALLAAHRLLGALETDAGQYEQATTHLGNALVLADACAAPYERTLTLLALAALRGARGDTDGAMALLDEAREIGARLGAKPALARADRIAAAVATAPTVKLVYPAGLSAREVEVLRLVATGLSNAQVAERLFLSPRTVNGHLTAIYAKLNVPSRSAAIRFAFDHDLHCPAPTR